MKRDYSVLSALAENLARIRSIFDEEQFIGQLRSLSGRTFAPIYADLGWDTREGDDHLKVLLRTLAVEEMLVAQDTVCVWCAPCITSIACD